MNAKSYRAARKSFERVLELSRHDTYALCSAGNLCLIFARGDPNPSSRTLHFSRSIEYFCKVLSLEPSNIHAAAGIAIAYAETLKYDEAKGVFSQILELSLGDTRMAMNAGHVLVELGEIIPAVTLYESILKKGGKSNDPNVLTALSRANYILAKTTKDVNAMKTSLKYTQRAIHASPNDMSLFFNLALIEQQIAQVLNEQTSENRSIESLKRALGDIERSERLFSFLGTVPSKTTGKYDSKRASERALFSNTVRKVSEKKIHEAEVLQRQKNERLKEIREMKERAELEKQRLEEERLETERQNEARLEASRRELFLRMQEENEKMRIEKSRREADSDINTDDEQDKPR
ncbi:hypothetical protein HDU91_004814 [Kappamyces sp. JEL0680]|nr:hypothetical protein HDU91_004814 [Kappamyces sp. JEL0680]